MQDLGQDARLKLKGNQQPANCVHSQEPGACLQLKQCAVACLHR